MMFMQMQFQMRWSLRFQVRVEEQPYLTQLLFSLAACYAVGSIDSMLRAGALVAEPLASEWLRSMLPERNGGHLTGTIARQVRKEIERFGFSMGGSEWRESLGARVAQGPISQVSDDSDDSSAIA